MNEEIDKNVLKTGTVTIGIVCKDGIVVAADKKITYASGGGIAYNAGAAKKIEEVNNRIIITTAGNASDTKKVIDIIRAETRIRELRTKVNSTVSEVASLAANMLFQNIRTPSMIPSIAHFLIAGYDEGGEHLFEVSPDGFIQEIKRYSATGSGIMQAHPVLDSEYRSGMSADDGVKLAAKCIKAATGRDPGVGAGIDIYVVGKDKFEQVLDLDAVLEYKEAK